MKKRTFVVLFVTAVALGSGFVNLFSVIGPSLPERMAQLRHLFPLEFAHLSRIVTLVIGFALIVLSINLYKRKRRAWQLAVALSALSIVFHFAKGLDYEEATFSLILLLLLLYARASFTVQSSIPDIRWGLLRFAVALVVVIVYGVAGFWLLERKEFGVNFHLNLAIIETFRFLSFAGDSGLVPQTRYARWFLASLYLLSACGVTYALWSLFRPVRYKFLTQPHERARATAILQQYGRHALDYFKLWRDKTYFFSKSGSGFLAYRVGANFAVVLADPVGPENEIEEIIRDFKTHCEQNDWGLAFHQTLPDFLPVYEKLGFKKFKVGDDAIVELDKFTLEGSHNKEFRQVLNKTERGGIQIRRWQPPIPASVLQQAKSVSDEWLQLGGRRERSFTLGLFDWDYVKSTPIIAALGPNGQMLAFVNVIPSYKQGEATLDLMRRTQDSPHGVMDFLFIKVLQTFKADGYHSFNLGMAPMSGFQEGEEASIEERAIHYFMQHMNFLFSFRGLRAYKAKFATVWEPRYVIYEDALDLAHHAIAMGTVSEL